jgi:hypothetical protein
MEEYTPPAQTPLPPPKNNSGIFMNIFLLLLGILIGLALGKTTLLQTLRIPYLSATPTPTPIPSPTPIPDPTANWKTYTNTKNNYLFKYPTNWTLNDLTEGLQVEIYYQPDRTKSAGSILIEKLQRPPGDIAQYTTKKQIGDLTADCKSDPTGIKEWCYLSDYILSVFITKDQNPTYNKTLNQILSTFKFTQPNTASEDRTVLENIIKDAVYEFGKSHGLTSKNQITITINTYQDGFASGTTAFTPDVEGSGNGWIAAKMNGQWTIVEQSQEPPSCKLMTQYKVPQSIYGSCIEK